MISGEFLEPVEDQVVDQGLSQIILDLIGEEKRGFFYLGRVLKRAQEELFRVQVVQVVEELPEFLVQNVQNFEELFLRELFDLGEVQKLLFVEHLAETVFERLREVVNYVLVHLLEVKEVCLFEKYFLLVVELLGDKV